MSYANVWIDDWVGRRSAVIDVLEVLGFSLLTALLAQLRVHLPFTPVPITGQTFGVLLAGAALGARRGFLSQAVYVMAGSAGLPVFAAGSLLGPTAGYLCAFPLAAFFVGWLVERGAARRILPMVAILLLADSCIMACGVLWLARFSGNSIREALILGFVPFWAGEILKIGLVALLLPAALRSTHRRVPNPS